MVERGQLRPIIDRVMPLEQARWEGQGEETGALSAVWVERGGVELSRLEGPGWGRAWCGGKGLPS